MDDRLKNLNKKISKSTIEIQKLMSQLMPIDRPPVNSFRSRVQPKDHQIINPEQTNKKYQSRVIVQVQPKKNSNVETNASTKFYQSRQKFNSFNQMVNTQQSRQRSSWVHMSPQYRTKGELNKDTKFAVGNNLYPIKNFQQSSSNQKEFSQQNISKIRSQVANFKSILEIDSNYILNYALSKQSLNERSKPQEIFDYFYQFSNIFKKPLIKKYKNCLYFGESHQQNNYRSHKYIGFLYFFTFKIYYGNLEQQYKHGLGVQINLKNGTIYKGNFNKGHKIGKFQVVCGDKIYEGQLNKGKFHGIGKLYTPISNYEGLFFNGMRHGEGQQYFFKSGLKLKGIFQMDKFCNDKNVIINKSKSSEATKKIQKKQQKQFKPSARDYKFGKINNLFDFSFHDSSEEQENVKKKFHIQWTTMKKRANLHKNLQKLQSSVLESASDDDPLPSPFRKVISNR